MNQPVTKGDLARVGMDALDRDRVGQVQVSAIAGGVSFASALEVMEFAKLLSTGGQAIPPIFRNNPGMCLAVTFQAIEWRMSPIAVINKSYVVNDRIAHESQLLHAVIEARAPLSERLNCTYSGEGPTRQCTIIGKFTDGTQRDYTTPMFKDIKVKNSPSWISDVDQQLFYFGSRSWSRKWCPDVLMGIYTRDELEANPVIGREEAPTGPTLVQRLSKADRSEGHNPDKAAAELDNVAAGAKVTILPPDPPKNEDGTPKRRRFGKRKGGAVGQATSGDTDTTSGDTAAPQQEAQVQQPEGAPPAAQTEPAATQHAPEPETASQANPPAPAEPPKQPTTGPEYIVYADRWIEAETDKENALARWEGDDPMRNDLMVSVRARITLLNKIKAKFGIEE